MKNRPDLTEALRREVVRSQAFLDAADALDELSNLEGMAKAAQDAAVQANADRDTALKAKDEAQAGIDAAKEEAERIIADANEAAAAAADKAKQAAAQSAEDAKSAKSAAQAEADAIRQAAEDAKAKATQDLIDIKGQTAQALADLAQAQTDLQTITAKIAAAKEAAADMLK